jgi:hypothetical protein
MRKLDRVLRHNQAVVGYTMCRQLAIAHPDLKMILPSSQERYREAQLHIPTRTHEGHSLRDLLKDCPFLLVDEGYTAHKHDIKFTHDQSDQFATVTDANPMADAMQYPLLFEYGLENWFQGATCTTKRPGAVKGGKFDIEEEVSTMTMGDFHRFILQDRDDDSPLLTSGPLSQQYFISCCNRVRSMNLNALYTKQKHIKAASYKAFQDAFARCLVDAVGKAIRCSILPPSYTMSPRFLKVR